MIKRIILLTSHFPYGAAETFLETELPFLCAGADQVEIFPVNDLSMSAINNPRPLPSNAKIRLDLNQDLQYRLKRRISRLIAALFDQKWWAALQEEWRYIDPIVHKSSSSRLTLIGRALSSWSCARIIKILLEREYNKTMAGTLFYSYWMYDSALALGLLRNENRDCRSVTRAHGSDLYAERRVLPYHPFTLFKITRLDKTILISEEGMRYLARLFPDQVDRMHLSRLGVAQHEIAPWSSLGNGIRILTCSALTPIKRIPLLVEALALCSITIEWTHIGVGPQLSIIKKQIASLPGHIEAKLIGQKLNREVLEFYASHPFDLFINVSEHEGLPVSIMEAQSFGIPVMAMNVGGNAELVSSQNGILLPADATPEQVAAAIENYSKLSTDEKSLKRFYTRRTWEEYSNANIQYLQFVQSLERLFTP